MSDYTPSTDEVRDRYAWGRSDVGYVSYDEAEAEFNQWLAEHDAKVKADALRDAAEAWAEDPESVDSETPADTRNWMRDRADKIEKEAGR